MADLVDSFTPSDPSDKSPFTFLNRLPTKRLDAKITRAAESGIPQQGAQTGGYTPSYLYLSHVPLFPLYSDRQHELLAKEDKHKQLMIKAMNDADPDKKLTGGQKAFLGTIGHLVGAGSIVSTQRWERRLVGSNVMSADSRMKQDKLLIFTRWTVPAPPGRQRQGPLWFVDVLEQRYDESSTSSLKSLSGNATMLKVGVADGRKVTLQLLKTEAKGIKTQKMWSKGTKTDTCEAMTFVGDNEIVAMEIVARIERTASMVEAMEVRKRFDKEWLVPMVQ
ncbi:hypothetical protein H2200_011580 [Cladophialophora chaetospira]|uniref:Uncharacterized protein n=1 Tax=Cladophialophora chaetospira TaxID=386627 RepID=A0AA39CDD0_9EURO|nr:hypothetical protein H2200_011580 [Cladophialophora chaetospira]